jgi:hypothetical protein
MHKIPLAIPILGLVDCPSQSRQSAKIFLQLPELGLPNPSPAGESAPPSGSGRRGTLAGERRGGRVPIPRGNMHCGPLYIYVLCAALPFAKSNYSVFQASPSITPTWFYPSALTLWSSVLRPFRQRTGCASWTNCDKEIGTLIKKKIKFSSYKRKFRVEQF